MTASNSLTLRDIRNVGREWGSANWMATTLEKVVLCVVSNLLTTTRTTQTIFSYLILAVAATLSAPYQLTTKSQIMAQSDSMRGNAGRHPHSRWTQIH